MDLGEFFTVSQFLFVKQSSHLSLPTKSGEPYRILKFRVLIFNNLVRRIKLGPESGFYVYSITRMI